MEGKRHAWTFHYYDEVRKIDMVPDMSRVAVMKSGLQQVLEPARVRELLEKGDEVLNELIFIEVALLTHTEEQALDAIGALFPVYTDGNSAVIGMLEVVVPVSRARQQQVLKQLSEASMPAVHPKQERSWMMLSPKSGRVEDSIRIVNFLTEHMRGL